VVTINAQIQRNDTLRCFKCQSFNHSKNFCFFLPKSASCAGDHDSKDMDKCPALKEDQFKCINCGSNHSASSCGCPAYLEQYEKRKSNSTSERQRTQTIVAPLPSQNAWYPLRPPIS